MAAVVTPFYRKSMVDAKHSCKMFYHFSAWQAFCHAHMLPNFQEVSLQMPMSPHARSVSAGVVSKSAID